MTTVYVHTLGDSTLDNVYWMLRQDVSVKTAKERSVEGQLQGLLGQKYKLKSHAFDGFTTDSVLNGDNIARVFGLHPEREPSPKLLNYLEGKKFATINDAESYFIQPLEKLRASIAKHPEAKHYVVISMGGNDFRERLNNRVAMIAEIPKIHSRYLEILDEVKKMGAETEVQPILMLQYPLDINDNYHNIYPILKAVGKIFAGLQATSVVGAAVSAAMTIAGKVSGIWGAAFGALSLGALYLSTRIMPLTTTLGLFSSKQDQGLTALGGLMESFYRPILARAKADNIPVLDLPNTFNPYKDLYTAQIEPNEKGGELIAQGIAKIIEADDGKTSKLWAKKPGDLAYKATENPGANGWKVTFPARV
ncbi:MAG: hypothetical protein LLF94_03515 [Chlamydiales bacterium]|nr:hypothetical protein [Chlamydiales bacterium]